MLPLTSVCQPDMIANSVCFLWWITGKLTNNYLDRDGYRVDAGFYGGRDYLDKDGNGINVFTISNRFVEVVPRIMSFYGARPFDSTIYLMDFSGNFLLCRENLALLVEDSFRILKTRNQLKSNWSKAYQFVQSRPGIYIIAPPFWLNP